MEAEKNAVVMEAWNGVVVDFFEDADDDVFEKIKGRYAEGYVVRRTSDRYVRKWGKWWITD